MACSSVRSVRWQSHPRRQLHLTVAGGLFAPYGVALTDDVAYVTCAVCVGGGEVIKIPLGQLPIRPAADTVTVGVIASDAGRLHPTRATNQSREG